MNQAALGGPIYHKLRPLQLSHQKHFQYRISTTESPLVHPITEGRFAGQTEWLLAEQEPIMICVGYFDGTVRAGLLAWRELPDGRLEAIGGCDAPYRTDPINPSTVVSTNSGDRELSGWVHPDDIPEISGILQSPERD